jgi:hypothetical protein
MIAEDPSGDLTVRLFRRICSSRDGIPRSHDSGSSRPFDVPYETLSLRRVVEAVLSMPDDFSGYEDSLEHHSAWRSDAVMAHAVLGSGSEFVRVFRETASMYRKELKGRAWCDAEGLPVPCPYEEGRQAGRPDRCYCANLHVPLSNEEVVVVGDVHSSLKSLCRCLLHLYERGVIDDAFRISPDRRFLFLGDLVDRGEFSLEVLFLVCVLKLRNGERVTILNGNHEDEDQWGQDEDGRLAVEMYHQFEGDVSKAVQVRELLVLLPSAVFARFSPDSVVQFSHGGIAEGYDPRAFIGSGYGYQDHGPDDVEHPLRGLKWSDFDTSCTGAHAIPNTARGTAHVYGPESVQRYLSKNDLRGIIRGHQDTVHFMLMGRDDNDLRDVYAHVARHTRSMPIAGGMWTPLPRDCEEDDESVNAWSCLSYIGVFDYASVVTTSTASRSRDTGYDCYLSLSRASADAVASARSLFAPHIRDFVQETGIVVSDVSKEDAARILGALLVCECKYDASCIAFGDVFRRRLLGRR